MGHSQDNKAKTHDRIVEIAARRFRERGLDGLSIADVMKEAGMTNGGFYKHFETRDNLVSESVAKALVCKTLEGVDLPENSTPNEKLAIYVSDYLSTNHRDNPGDGCAVAGLVSDIARSDDTTRRFYTDQVDSNIAALQAVLRTMPPGSDRVMAINAIASMTGALGLARAVSSDELSIEILDSVRTYLLEAVSKVIADPKI